MKMSLKGPCTIAIFLLSLILAEASVFIKYDNHVLEIKSENLTCKEVDERAPNSELRSTPLQEFVYKVPKFIFNQIFKVCKRLSSGGTFVFPGTKWCGPGNTARYFDDLGEKVDTDRCCRQHDHCPVFLEPGQCRRGICNTSPFTKFHCNCDKILMDCLQRQDSLTANIVGSLYFNVGQHTCFRERRDCTQSMRNNLSYSWFCEEWKFVPSSNFVPSVTEQTNKTQHINEVPDDRKVKTEHSKIDRDLETIFGNDDEITRIMNDYKTLRN